MKPLKSPLPPGRSVESVWRHYQVETDIAMRLKTTDRAGRRAIFATMYDELFSAVPDHPRLMRRADAEFTAAANADKWRTFGPFLDGAGVALEFAPGDCEFARSVVAPKVGKIYGLDISDQRRPGSVSPPNFELMLYDGYSFPPIARGSVDVVYSDQLLEHLHPEDAEDHLLLVREMLRPGGKYIIRTPHAHNGPWDVSRYFSDTPEGFHLKEWTYGELAMTLRRLGYLKVQPIWSKRSLSIGVPLPVFRAIEFFGKRMDRRTFRPIARYVAPALICVASK